MRASSTRFANAVTGSHRIATELESWRGGELLGVVEFADGSVEADGERAVPGSLKLTIPAGPSQENVPRDPLHPLAPYGQRIHVSRGVVFQDSTRELLDLGWFQIESCDPDYLSGQLTLEAVSLEEPLDEAKLPTPRQVPAGATFLSELEALVEQRLPVSEVLGVADRACPTDRLWEGSRLEAIGQLAAAWPARIRCDDQGVLTVLAPVDQLTPAQRTPVLTLETGERGVVAKWNAPTSREELYNAVFARGEEATGDARAVNGYAYDNDPNSPTLYGGPFGERVLEYASPLLATKAAADAAALTILKRRLRRSRTVTVELVPDPRLQLDDYVTLDTPEVKGTGRIAKLVLPLGTGTMTLELDDVEEDA